MHGGISISNFTAGRRRENNSVAFGKAAVGNELLGNAFFPGLMPSAVTKRQAGSETCVSGYTQASLSRPARLASLAMRQGRRLHNDEVLRFFRPSFRNTCNHRYDCFGGVPCVCLLALPCLVRRHVRPDNAKSDRLSC